MTRRSCAARHPDSTTPGFRDWLAHALNASQRQAIIFRTGLSDADELAAHPATATEEVRRAAAAALGLDNPVGRALQRELAHQPQEVT